MPGEIPLPSVEAAGACGVRFPVVAVAREMKAVMPAIREGRESEVHGLDDRVQMVGCF